MSEFRNGLLSLSYAIAYLGFLILALASIFGGILVIDIRSSNRKSQQLQQLVTEIEASVEMKDKFMSAVSHELRTPLTSILGGISLLKSKFSDELDGGANKLIDIANRNAERLLSLVNDILEVQSLSEGKLTLQKDYVNLTSIIASTVEECSSYANQLGIRLLFISPEDEIIVFVDQSRISQVVNNFLSTPLSLVIPGRR
jgi:signal transduction histidine kinase